MGEVYNQSSFLADSVISEINKGLVEHFEWLDKAYGRAERLLKNINGKSYKLPAFYIGSENHTNEYIELSPDSKIGNFSFFWMLDPEDYVWRPNIQGLFRSPFALIFWFDFRKITGSLSQRNLSYLEAEILSFLNRKIGLRTGSLEINTVYRLPESIYREFTLDAVDNQFLMHPYGGLRFEGTLIFEEPCLE